VTVEGGSKELGETRGWGSWEGRGRVEGGSILPLWCICALYNPSIVHSCNLFDIGACTSIVSSVFEHTLLFRG